jgi:DNA-binding NarL/FixJ family response regulator
MQPGDVYLLERDQIHAEHITRVLKDCGYTVHRLAPTPVPSRVSFRKAVLLVNLSTARLNLLEFLSGVFQNSPVACMALGIEPSDAELLEAVRLGITGYVDLNRLDEDLVRAIEEVSAGSVWLPRRILRQVVEQQARHQFRRRAADGHRRVLTVREEEVLSLLLDGRSYKEIANSLEIVERTVKAHVAHLLAKFQVANRHELAAKLRNMGYL